MCTCCKLCEVYEACAQCSMSMNGVSLESTSFYPYTENSSSCCMHNEGQQQSLCFELSLASWICVQCKHTKKNIYHVIVDCPRSGCRLHSAIVFWYLVQLCDIIHTTTLAVLYVIVSEYTNTLIVKGTSTLQLLIIKAPSIIQ